MESHTPGPWVRCSGDARRLINIECKGCHNNLLPIATLRGSDRAANANLIAAAPELLTALKEALPWLLLLGDKIGNGTPTDPDGRCRAVLAVRDAIAKAEGKSCNASA